MLMRRKWKGRRQGGPLLATTDTVWPGIHDAEIA
jgi:hypothetical protein